MVVAIIALLISILLPSLRKSREVARRSVCTNLLHQQGIGFTSYAADSRGKMPIRAGFGYYVGWTRSSIYGDDCANPTTKTFVNYAMLYPRYSGPDPNLFYCPTVVGSKDYYLSPDYGYSTFKLSDNTDKITFGGYMYAAPVAGGCSPDLNAKDVYTPKGTKSDGGIWNDNFKFYLERFKGYSASTTAANSYTKYRSPPLQLIETDAVVGAGVKTMHEDGVNALFNDMHARFVNIPNLKQLNITSGRGGAQNLYDTWELISRKP